MWCIVKLECFVNLFVQVTILDSNIVVLEIACIIAVLFGCKLCELNSYFSPFVCHEFCLTHFLHITSCTSIYLLSSAINECKVPNICGRSAACEDLTVGYRCMCPVGFRYDFTTKECQSKLYSAAIFYPPHIPHWLLCLFFVCIVLLLTNPSSSFSHFHFTYNLSEFPGVLKCEKSNISRPFQDVP